MLPLLLVPCNIILATNEPLVFFPDPCFGRLLLDRVTLGHSRICGGGDTRNSICNFPLVKQHVRLGQNISGQQPIPYGPPVVPFSPLFGLGGFP